MTPTLSSLVTPDVVILTNNVAARDDNVGIMITLGGLRISNNKAHGFVSRKYR